MFEEKLQKGKEANSVEKERIERKKEIIRELTSFCKENGNEIKFINEGSEWYPSISDVPINQEKINSLFSEKERDLVILALQVFKFYLSCPCFIDSFGTNNKVRRAWEKEKIIPGKTISNDAYNFYSRNKITKNQFSAPIFYLADLEGSLENSNIKEIFQDLIKNAHLEEFFFGKDDQTAEYLVKTTEEQLEIVKKFELMVRAIVLLLENPPSPEAKS